MKINTRLATLISGLMENCEAFMATFEWINLSKEYFFAININIGILVFFVFVF